MHVPWRDRRGRFQPLKAVALACCAVPGLVYGGWWISGDLGGRPITAAIHGMGDWAIRFLLLSLAVTPFARIADWPQLLTARRIVGVTALFYALAHFLLYIADQKFRLLTVASEIVMRFYLTIGFIALAGLAALGATSTDAAMRRMGKRWKHLHRLAYPIGFVTLLHYYIQTKANVAEPVFVSGLFLWLMLWRALPMPRRTFPGALYAMIPVSTAMTMAVEYAWYGLATRIDPMRIFDANWSVNFFPRPAHLVAATALAVAVGVSARRWQRGRPANPSPRLRATIS